MIVEQPTPAGVVVARLPAEVDIAVAGQVRTDLTASLSQQEAHLVIDASETTFMDSSGVNALVHAHEEAVRLGGTLHVVSTRSAVRRVLEITGLAGRLGLTTSIEDAYRCVAGPETRHTCHQRS